jgi:4-hydroxy-tetrahydrodipicolinate synthase
MDVFGVSVALLTPFTASGDIDAARLGAHARALLDRGADSVTLYGTTGEGASIGQAERTIGIEALLSAGCPAPRIVLGVCATSVSDAVAQVAEGSRYGIAEYLLLPPFYFKGNSDEGLHDWHAQIFARADTNARFILYHIPQVTGVGLSINLVGRLAATAPGRLRAIKDSSGDWNNAKALLDLGALTVLVGDERLLHRAMALGAGGAITGMANLYPERMKRIVDTATEDAALSEEVGRIVSVPVIPALKAVIAARSGEPAWERLRAPLSPLDAAARAKVLDSGLTVA